jgi:hypothetical protein
VRDIEGYDAICFGCDARWFMGEAGGLLLEIRGKVVDRLGGCLVVVGMEEV